MLYIHSHNDITVNWLISACAYSSKRNDSMRLIKDMRLYGTYPRPQTFGHVMDARPARTSASWLDRSSALAFTAAVQDDECWRFV